MSKLFFVSNRLPVTVSNKSDTLEYNESIGGLATGLKSYHEQSDGLWVGWPGISSENITDEEKKVVSKELQQTYKCSPVFLSNKELDDYYFGFSNNTLWPLFHYFTNKVEYEFDTWKAYQKVNSKFFEVLDEIIEDNDTVWIHDYQLMLLPNMLREKYPNLKIGFFLHIPFPSYEIFRLLIWREELLQGILGADLIGFHTYDYVRHFLSSTRRLLGLEHNLNVINNQDRYVKVDVFPMGIDYERFSKEITDENMLKEIDQIAENVKDTQMILSIDRLDYTKGIPGKIRAFDKFLRKYPEYKEKVKLTLIVAPSRVSIETYEELRREITELVSEVNGKHSTLSWMPIWFFFQSFTQESLTAFYKNADVLLVTPIRDGMNLVVKEYIAARSDYEGMVVVSETAGVASEIGEAVVVNPNDYYEIAEGLKTALEMPTEEKIAINKLIHKRLKRYNVDFWASEFLSTLQNVANETSCSITLSLEKESSLVEESYKKAKNRVIFLDYDGTLVGFKSIPEKAKPDAELKELLRKVVNDKKNTVIIVSGRDRHTLQKWLGDLNVTMVASHGLWLKTNDTEWTMNAPLDNSWKSSVQNILQLYYDRMPGSLIEEKEYSIAFHYRQCEPDLVAVKLSEVKDALLSMTQSMNLEIQEGNKVFEIKDNRVNKGYIASSLIQDKGYDFIMGVGDDFTDEYLFTALPDDAYTIKIGLGNTNAHYHLKSWKSTRKLLNKLLE